MQLGLPGQAHRYSCWLQERPLCRFALAWLLCLSLAAVAAGISCAAVVPSSGGAGAIGPDVNHQFSETIDIVSLGADPTDTADSSTAIEAAIATGKTVIVPAGSFHIAHMLSLGPGQRMVCMGRAISQITVGSDFSPTDPAVVRLATGDPSSEIENCGISFAQPTNITTRSAMRSLAQGCTVIEGGTGCMYPPAICAPGSIRFRLFSDRISGAWDGVMASGNVGGLWIENLEIGALNRGLFIDGGLDFCHIKGFHFWPFGLVRGTTYATVYQDGRTYAAQLGHCDGMTLDDYASFQGRTEILPTATQVTFGTLSLDGNHANLEVDGGDVRVGAGYSTKNAAVSDSSIKVTAGNLDVGLLHITGDTPSPLISVSGGLVNLHGGFLDQASPAGQAILVTGGSMLARNFMMLPHAVAYTLPYIQENGGLLDLQGSKWSPQPIGGSGTAVQIGVDAPQQVVSSNDLGGWTYAPPPGGVLGTYGPNKTPVVPWTPAIAFSAAPGVTITYAGRWGHYAYTGAGIAFSATMLISVNAYEGVQSGHVLITGLPFANRAISFGGEGLARVDVSNTNYDTGYTSMLGKIGNPPNAITLLEVGPGKPNIPVTPAIFAPGASDIMITVSGLIATN